MVSGWIKTCFIYGHSGLRVLCIGENGRTVLAYFSLFAFFLTYFPPYRLLSLKTFITPRWSLSKYSPTTAANCIPTWVYIFNDDSLSVMVLCEVDHSKTTFFIPSC